MSTRGGPQRIPRPPDSVPGAPPPWLAPPRSDGPFTAAHLRHMLARRRPRRPVVEAFTIRRTAAVLVPLYETRDGLHVLLTRRPWSMRSHGGEVSFPGGGQDPTDPNLAATALREAWEEIGLPADHVEIIGQLDPLATLASRAHITPFVGLVDPLPELRPAPDEVDAILDVSLEELLNHEVFREERWPASPDLPPSDVAPDGWRRMYFFELAGDTVWGATARMLHQLLRIATETEDR